MSNEDIEIQKVTIIGNGLYQKQIAVVLVHRPPNIQIAHDLIIKYINEILNIDNKELLVMGNFNWNFLDKTSRGYKLINNNLMN